MSTLAEIEAVVPTLTVAELENLESILREVRRQHEGGKDRPPAARRALDLPPLVIGEMIPPLSPEDDLLREMLDETRL